MEKRTPHCKLTVVKKLIEAGKVRMTASAAAGGEQLGFDKLTVIDDVLIVSFKEL
jgi:motility quorum-sensing regulator/GCU-specific mRNA interferase toxin